MNFIEPKVELTAGFKIACIPIPIVLFGRSDCHE